MLSYLRLLSVLFRYFTYLFTIIYTLFLEPLFFHYLILVLKESLPLPQLSTLTLPKITVPLY